MSSVEISAVSDRAPAPGGASSLLEVDDLKVHFTTDDGVVKAVDGISFTVGAGQTFGIVGESGSGKSVTSTAILGLQRGRRTSLTGSIRLGGRELSTMDEAEIRKLRGDEMAMIFQDPLTAMHPFYTVGKQISEAYLVHHDVTKKQSRARVVEMLERVGIPNPDRRYDDYPHQFSGGMRQRAMIAMALVNNPRLIIADEPTTALDVTVQAQILDLMKDVQREFNSAIILITHDLGVVAEACDTVMVMYGGQAVEQGSVEDIFYRPEMPYAWGLLGSMPRLDRGRTERLRPIAGSPPSLINVPKGCVFNPRCDYQHHVEGDRCTTLHPDLLPSSAGHSVRCHIDRDERARLWETEVRPGL